MTRHQKVVEEYEQLSNCLALLLGLALQPLGYDAKQRIREAAQTITLAGAPYPPMHQLRDYILGK